MINIEIDKIAVSKTGNKSPGIPWAKLYASNSDFLENRVCMLKAVVSRCYVLIECTNIKALTVPELIDGNFCDPIAAFIKNELHPIKKCKSGKFRLIFQTSIIDLLIEDVLFKIANKRHIKDWESVPSLPGIGFHDDGYNRARNIFKAISEIASSDVSGMDWTVKFEHAVEYWHMMCSTYQISVDSILARMMYNRIYCFMSSLIVFPNGDSYEQLKPAIVKSGGKLTSSMDSFVRWLWFIMAGWLMCKEKDIDFSSWLSKHMHEAHAMGDDCIERYFHGFEEHYISLGVTMKNYERVNFEESFDFCGHVFSNDNIKLVRWTKSLAEMLNRTYNDKMHQMQAFAGIQFELRWSDEELETFSSVLERAGWWLEN